MYHYISGYTAKVAGTEAGVTEPKATFSPCFGGPFLPLHPMRYARLLGDKLAQHGVGCWLVNTGWSGGPYGTGSRIVTTPRFCGSGSWQETATITISGLGSLNFSGFASRQTTACV